MPIEGSRSRRQDLYLFWHRPGTSSVAVTSHRHARMARRHGSLLCSRSHGRPCASNWLAWSLINNQLAQRTGCKPLPSLWSFCRLLLGGAQIQFLRGTRFIRRRSDWAGAISAAFIYCALRGLVAKREFSVGLIAGMASLAGLSLLTRVSTALGLYVAIGLLIAALAWPSAGSLRDRMFLFFRGLTSRRTVVGFAILLSFVVLAGVVNYQRWGNPLEFYYDPRTYIGYMTAPWRLARLEAYGVFNIERLWYGIVYYFFPIWTISRPDGQFLFAEFETRMIDAVETPQSSFLLSDPLLLVLAGAYLLRLPRLVRERLLDPRAVAALMIGLFGTCVADIDIHVHGLQVPDGVLSISRILGLSWILCDLRKSHEFSIFSRLGLLPDPDCQCCICDRLFAFCAPPRKNMPPGNYVSEGADAGGVSAVNGWLDYYRLHLRTIFPNLAQRLHL